MGYARLEVATASAAGLADSCLIDLAHAPLADEGGHVVVGDARADVQRHGLWMLVWRLHITGGGLEPDDHRPPIATELLCRDVDEAVRTLPHVSDASQYAF